MPDVIIEVPDQQQLSSPLIQNNNGNDRSHTSTGVGAQEKSIPITDLLKMVAKMLGVVVCGWVVLVLVQGGMVGTVETKDRGFITMLFFLVCFRCWRHYCPQAPGSLTEATQSLSADYLSIPNDIQQLAVPICYIHRLFYCSRLVSTMTSIVLSIMRLSSQDFGKKEVENKESRDFALKVFYGLTLAEALVLLFAEALSFPIRGNSVGLADGSGDGLEVGLITKGNSVGLADGPGDGPNDGPGDRPEDSPRDGPKDRPADGPENGPGGEPEDGYENGPGGEPGDGPGDVPVNQSNECNAVAQMDRPADQSNDFNSEGSRDSSPNLRQRRREISQQKMGVKLSKENARKRMKALTTAAGDGIDSVSLKKIMRKKLGYADVINQIKEERRQQTRPRSFS
ncbi:uncharacterized protein LOC144548444 isoform X2 [Carex rostrata]